MRNHKLLTGVVLILLVLVFLVIYQSQNSKEPSFTSVELKNGNSIINNTLPNYYDTIISVGLEIYGIEGVTVFVEELSEESKKSFSGELNAHVRYLNGSFYLFIDSFNKQRAITIISHEIVHIKQYLDGTFIYNNGEINWNGKTYLLEDMNYDDRPWESQAFEMESKLGSQISEVVYQ